MAGMEREKQIVARRIVLPLQHPAVADRLGVAPLNRPGFGGDSISCKDSSHGTSFLLPA